MEKVTTRCLHCTTSTDLCFAAIEYKDAATSSYSGGTLSTELEVFSFDELCEMRQLKHYEKDLNQTLWVFQ